MIFHQFVLQKQKTEVDLEFLSYLTKSLQNATHHLGVHKVFPPSNISILHLVSLINVTLFSDGAIIM